MVGKKNANKQYTFEQLKQIYTGNQKPLSYNQVAALNKN